MKDEIVMSKDQLKVYRLALKVIDGSLKVKDFAVLVGCTERGAYKKLARIRDMDYIGALHGNTSSIPVNRTSAELEERIVHLLKTKYEGFNLTHFREKLEEDEGVIIKKTTLQSIAKRHQLQKYPKRSRTKVHKPRPRMPQEGMLVQYDGSPHIWFGEESSVLLAAIDDATGTILAARFVEGETSLNGMRLLKQIIDERGIPEAFYMDQAGIYGKLDRDFTSQIARALQTLHCRLHIASSPQAKGRVERLFRTLQDRLVSELKLRGTWNLEDANEYLKEFIGIFNRQFGVKAQDPTLAYLPNVFGDLDLIFCRKEQRKVVNGNVFSFDSHHWVIDEKWNYNHRIVNVNTHLDGTRSFDIMGKVVKVSKISRKSFLKTGT